MFDPFQIGGCPREHIRCTSEPTGKGEGHDSRVNGLTIQVGDQRGARVTLQGALALAVQCRSGAYHALRYGYASSIVHLLTLVHLHDGNGDRLQLSGQSIEGYPVRGVPVAGQCQLLSRAYIELLVGWQTNGTRSRVELNGLGQADKGNVVLCSTGIPFGMLLNLVHVQHLNVSLQQSVPPSVRPNHSPKLTREDGIYQAARKERTK